MIQPNASSPERAAAGRGKKIPIQDTDDTQKKGSPCTQAADVGGKSDQKCCEDVSAREASSCKIKPQEDSACAKDFQPGEASPEDKAAKQTAACKDQAEEEPNYDELIAQVRVEAQEWQDKFMRLHAEWDTYRRRIGEQRKAERVLATEKLVSGLIPVIDDFERTISYAQSNGEAGLLDGVEAVHTKFLDVLRKGGVEIVDPVGEAFNALEAQAVATIENVNIFDETVHEVYQKGYKMGHKVLRPAMVTVTTGGPKREKPEQEEKEKKQ